MINFSLASLVYIGVLVGTYLVIGVTAAIFNISVPDRYGYPIWFLAFCAVVGAGYIYAAKREHERMRRITLLLPLILTIHIIGSLAWIYVEPLLSHARG